MTKCLVGDLWLLWKKNIFFLTYWATCVKDVFQSQDCTVLVRNLPPPMNMTLVWYYHNFEHLMILLSFNFLSFFFPICFHNRQEWNNIKQKLGPQLWICCGFSLIILKYLHTHTLTSLVKYIITEIFYHGIHDKDEWLLTGTVRRDLWT